MHRPPDEGSLLDESVKETAEWLEKNFESAAACGHEWVLEKENRQVTGH